MKYFFSIKHTLFTFKFFIRIIFFIIILNISIVPLKAQEMLGIINSNYAGTNGVIINPSSMLSSKLYLDINIISGDIFEQNNYVYLSKSDYKFFRFFERYPHYPVHGEQNEIAYYNIDSKDKKNAFLNLRINGPSLMLIKGDHAFGFQTDVRSATSLTNMPYDVANFIYKGIRYKPQQGINYIDKEFDFGSLTWGEVGLSYAYAFYKRDRSYLSAGITIKRLFSYSGAYINCYNANYVVPNDTLIDINNLNAEVGFSLPMDYNNNDFPLKEDFYKGKGWGFDIGITYQKKINEIENRQYNRFCKENYQDYRYRIGLSLLDFGTIKFKKNAQKHSYNDIKYHWENIRATKYKDINHFSKMLSSQFYNDSTASFQSKQFSIALPTALSLQFDYHYRKQWYFNSTFIYGIHLIGDGYIQRPSIISIIPRYERRNIEFDFPISLYDMKDPRLGFSARLLNFTIGTDKLRGFFNYSNFSGIDIYFSVKINFVKGHCFSLRRWEPCQNIKFKRY